jgi:hypothetical protein
VTAAGKMRNLPKPPLTDFLPLDKALCRTLYGDYDAFSSLAVLLWEMRLGVDVGRRRD